ncbi:gustatory and pheromone receptor 32a-like [Vespa velutina]|uniref:gustatory and pheromone receptor 32a-like n=1 Tax=Vespa velutina TaxID=202808 RepID=UPI001FB4F61F|nr:gustatory and pheromone receptor 32a-like [Vespa velutina]
MVYAFFSISFYVYMSLVFSKYFVHTPVFKQSLLLQLMYLFYINKGYMTYVATIIIGFIRRKKVRRFIFQMGTCTRTMHQLNIPINLSKHFLQQCYIMLFLVFILIATIIIDYKWLKLLGNYPTIIFASFYLEIYPFITWLIPDVTFAFWIRYIKIKFCQLNELLKGMLTTTIHSPQHKRILRMRNRNNNSPLSTLHRTDKPSKDVITIKKAKEIHLELIKCARNINDAYALHILFSISLVFVLITITAYYVYYYLLTNSYSTQPLNSFTYLFWFFYFGIKIIIVSHICAETVTEIHNFILQLIQNPLSFTIYGLVDLDYTLIRTVIGTVTTYLVILIQVGNVPQEFSSKNLTLSSNDSRKI